MIELPKTVRIGGFIYDVIYPHVFIEEFDYTGSCSYYAQELKISGVGNSVERSDYSIVSTFLHELVHAIDYVYCGNCLEERSVEKLETLLFSIIRSNPLLFSEDTPKRVDILGNRYEVLYPHVFEDAEGNLSIIDMSRGVIMIKDSIDSIVVKKPIITVALLFSIFCSGEIKNILGDGEEYPFTSKKLKSFCNGLYQVIIDNNIEELFRKLSD